jgi:hypothetical protein
MAEITKKSNDIAFSVNILIKKDADLYIAHCLELDVVATGKNVSEAEEEIISLVWTQIDYAFSNNNLDHLYHPAPPEVWEEFFSCNEQTESKYKFESGFQPTKERSIVPPWLIAKTCQSDSLCHA